MAPENVGTGQCGAVTAFDGWASVGPDQGLKVDIYRYVHGIGFASSEDMRNHADHCRGSNRDIYCSNIGIEGVVYPGITDLISNGVPEATSAYFGVKVSSA